MIFFPDTHFFLHFKDPSELPWAQLTEEPKITLIVGRAVQKEIEKLKYELRGRPQDRARIYSKKLAEIAINRKPEILRESKPQIVLDYNIDRHKEWKFPVGLCPTWGDDLVIADVLAFRHLKPGVKVAILTSDPGLIAKALQYGISVEPLNDRDWELPREKSQEQKELEKLRCENNQLKQSGPLINCTLEIDGASQKNISLSINRYPELTQKLLEEVMSEATNKHRRVLNFGVPSPDFEPPTREQVDAYLKSYDVWCADLKAFLQETATRLNENSAEINVSLVVHNEGYNPAFGVNLSIETLGGFFLSEIQENNGEGSDKKASIGPINSKLGKFRNPPPSLHLNRNLPFRRDMI